MNILNDDNVQLHLHMLDVNSVLEEVRLHLHMLVVVFKYKNLQFHQCKQRMIFKLDNLQLDLHMLLINVMYDNRLHQLLR